MSVEFLTLLYLLTTVLIFAANFVFSGSAVPVSSAATTGTWNRVSSPAVGGWHFSKRRPTSVSPTKTVRTGLSHNQAEALLDRLEANGLSHWEVVLSPTGDYTIRV